MRRHLRRMILAFVLGGVLVGCLPISDFLGPSEAEATSGPSVVRIGFTEALDSLNPYVGRNDVSHFFCSLIYDNLACVGNDLETVSNLAISEWAVPVGYDSDPNLVGMPYGSVWQFNLSTNAYWSNGDKFTADDAVYSISLYNPVIPYYDLWCPTPYSYFIHDAWKIDDNTVRMSFWDRATLDPLPASFAYLPPIPMVSKKLMAQLPGGYSYIGMNWTGVFPDEMSPGMPMVGTGPFMPTPSILNDWTAGDMIKLLKNPNCHWATDYQKLVKFDELILKFYQDEASMVQALEENELDAAAVSQTACDSIKNDLASGALTSVTIFDGPKVPPYFTYLGFCMNDVGPNRSRLDPVIRQALHKAIDKTYIVDNMYRGYAEEGTTLVSPIVSDWHYEPTPGEKLDFNLTEARSMLEAAGYIDADGNGRRDCTVASKAVQMGWASEGTDISYQVLVRKEHPEEQSIAQYLKSQWEQIGVGVQCIVVEELTLSSIAYSYNYDAIIWDWSAEIDPNYILYVQTRSAWAGWSDNKYYNRSFDENYTNSVTCMDQTSRGEYVDNCQRIHYNDSAYVILAYPNSTYALRDDTVSEWGDWTEHPGRSLDNPWTGNPLFFDLKVNETVDDTDKNGDVLADYWWLAPVAAIAVAVAAVSIYLKRRSTT